MRGCESVIRAECAPSSSYSSACSASEHAGIERRLAARPPFGVEPGDDALGDFMRHGHFARCRYVFQYWNIVIGEVLDRYRFREYRDVEVRRRFRSRRRCFDVEVSRIHCVSGAFRQWRRGSICDRYGGRRVPIIKAKRLLGAVRFLAGEVAGDSGSGVIARALPSTSSRHPPRPGPSPPTLPATSPPTRKACLRVVSWTRASAARFPAGRERPGTTRGAAQQVIVDQVLELISAPLRVCASWKACA